MAANQKSLSTLRTLVRNFLDETTASFWTNAQLLTYINQAKDRVWNETRKVNADFFLNKIASTDATQTILGVSYAPTGLQVTVGGDTITLPPDFVELKLFETITSGYEDVRFIARDMANPDWRRAREITSNSTPTDFYFAIVNERTMYYVPKSDTALDTRLFYVYQPADLSADSDTMQMPYPLEHAVVFYATASALLQDRNGAAAVFEQRAARVIADALAAVSRQMEDSQVVVGAFADWNGW